MKNVITIIMTALMILTVSGCGAGVSQEVYDELAQERGELTADVSRLTETVDELKEEIEILQIEVGELEDENNELQSRNETLEDENKSLEDKLAAAQAPAVAAYSDSSSVTRSSSGSSEAEYSYIGNRNTRKFHRPTCGYLPEEHNRVYYSARQDAINAGMAPCKRCNP